MTRKTLLALKLFPVIVYGLMDIFCYRYVVVYAGLTGHELLGTRPMTIKRWK